jgi:hypothetical protein
MNSPLENHEVRLRGLHRGVSSTSATLAGSRMVQWVSAETDSVTL